MSRLVYPIGFLLSSAMVSAQAPEGAKPAAEGKEVSANTYAAASTPREHFFDILNNDRLIGDWDCKRTWLEDKGIEFCLCLTTIYQHNARGGLQTRNGHRVTGSMNYELMFDLEAMGIWDGGDVYVYAESGWGNGIGENRVGNLFGVNGDAMGDYAIQLSELWYEQSLWDGKARFRLGKYDITVDFDGNAYANDETSQFINPALINAGNIPFPDYGLGAQLIVQPFDWMYIGLAAVDAQTDGRETGFRTTFHDEDYFFGAFELGFLPVWETRLGKLPGGYRLGMWYDPQPKEMFFNDLDGRRRTIPLKRDDVGFYFNMDQALWKERPDDEDDAQGMGMFFRYSYAHPDTNEIEHFWSIGAQYQGLIPTRDDDVLGFGFAQGILSGKLRDLEGGDRESVYELYYNASVFPWLTITPDLQYIVNPGAADGRDSFVAGVRVQMSF